MVRWQDVIASMLLTGCGQREVQQELERKIELLEVQNNELQQSINAYDSAAQTYDACIADAYSVYTARWNSTCASYRRDDFRQRSWCREQGGSEEQCSVIAIRPPKDCSLPVDLVNQYDSGLKDDQRLCMDRLKLGR